MENREAIARYNIVLLNRAGCRTWSVAAAMNRFDVHANPFRRSPEMTAVSGRTSQAMSRSLDTVAVAGLEVEKSKFLGGRLNPARLIMSAITSSRRSTCCLLDSEPRRLPRLTARLRLRSHSAI